MINSRRKKLSLRQGNFSLLPNLTLRKGTFLLRARKQEIKIGNHITMRTAYHGRI